MRLDMLIAHARDERLVAVEQAELLEAAPQREVRARERDVRLERRGRGRDPCGWVRTPARSKVALTSCLKPCEKKGGRVE